MYAYYQACLVILGSKVTRVVRAAQALLDLQDLEDHWDLKDTKAHQETLEQQDTKVHPVKLVIQAPQEDRDRMVL